MYNVRGNDPGNHCGSAEPVFDRGSSVSEVVNDRASRCNKS